ncbi:MAG TPA: tripartite tricarboxylate transporter substrate binding protein [Xanthobacteraceae bacterium]|nr:tripartite tricarboxylate transporter substrate binding protein [Xanthobacteraceae bacterium]
MTQWIVAAATAAILIAAEGPGAAQTYPDHIIKAIVPYTAGGPIDVTTRVVAKRLGEVLGHSVIVENRPGASGMIANKAAATAEPDGYTLLFGNTSTLVVFPSLARTRDFDVLKRLTPVAKLIQGYEVMVVDPAGPANTLPEFIAYAKANPGKLNYGSVGFGNLTHVAGELLKLKTGIEIQHVPYKGAPELIAGLLSGQVQMNFTDVAGALTLARQGKIRPLAIASAMRDPKATDIPTFIEQGVPDFLVPTFTGVMVPAGTPSAIVAKLHDAINAVLTNAESRTMLENAGSSVRPGTAEEFATFLAAEQHRWEEVVTLAGLRGE